jgi:hypothetical protein
MNEWPPDADGEVLRSLKEAGLDFSKPYQIHFNIDFDDWPPKPEAIALLRALFPTTQMAETSGGKHGSVRIELLERLSYEVIMGIQMEVSREMRPFGGVCKCWGVLRKG